VVVVGGRVVVVVVVVVGGRVGRRGRAGGRGGAGLRSWSSYEVGGVIARLKMPLRPTVAVDDDEVRLPRRHGRCETGGAVHPGRIGAGVVVCTRPPIFGSAPRQAPLRKVEHGVRRSCRRRRSEWSHVPETAGVHW